MSVEGFSGELAAVFPDWSPYRDLGEAARAYLRDPEVALDALDGVLGGRDVRCFTLERFVNDDGGVWQEATVFDGSRLVLWHGEDVVSQESTGPEAAGSMTSSLRVIPVSAVTEVGCRHGLRREPNGSVQVNVIDVYVLLSALDSRDNAASTPARQDTLRFVKTLADGGTGQIARLEEFVRVVASAVGSAAG